MSADPKEWRGIAARVASMLHTPLPQVLELDWADCLLWWAEADKIHTETFGLLAGRLPDRQ